MNSIRFEYKTTFTNLFLSTVCPSNCNICIQTSGTVTCKTCNNNYKMDNNNMCKS